MRKNFSGGINFKAKQVKGKRISFSFGWFSGDPFILLKLSFMENHLQEYGVLNIITIHIAKFMFDLSFCYND